MGSNAVNIIVDWKRLWQLVSGIHRETPESTVLEELLNVSKELQDGLLQYKTCAASNTELQTLLADKKQEKLLAFTQGLQELLDLETRQCWEILCFYLANEYRGSASFLTTLISTESSMSKLLDDIWCYYVMERMFLLRIVKNLFNFYKMPDHPYHNEYTQIIDGIGIDKLKESYIKQLEYLINEVPSTKLTSGEFFHYQSILTNWSERNAREIIEILHIILLICEHHTMNVNDIKCLFNSFKQHSFGRQQSYFNASNAVHIELSARMAYAEIAVFLKLMDFENTCQQTTTTATVKAIIEAIDKDIIRSRQIPEYGPLFLSWMLLYLRYTNAAEDEQQLLRCRQIGKRALDLNCFEFMYRMISNRMFQEDFLVSRIVRKTVYNLLSYFCDYFDGDGSCSQYSHIYELLNELVSLPNLAKEFCSHEDEGVHSLYKTLLETFPIDFIHLSMLATALTKGGMGTYIKNQLEALPILTDIYDDNKYSLENIREDEFIVAEEVQPFPRIDFTIPSGTSVVITNRKEYQCAHFRLPVNYFNVLHHEINCLLTETIQFHDGFYSNERMRRVKEGLDYMVVALGNIKTLAGISAEMVHPTEMAIDLLNKFKDIQTPPIELMATCLNVCTALIPLVPEEIFIRAINLGILPIITNDTLDYKKYAHGVSFDSCLVGSYLVDVEKKLERFDFLLAYLHFLRKYTKLQLRKYFQIEIPGLIFVLRYVFPHVHAWRFQIPQEKHEIYGEILGFICDILDDVMEAVNNCEYNAISDQQQLLRNICVYNMLNLENGLILLRFVALGNGYLQQTMSMESNWMVSQGNSLLLLVRLAMRILMHILRLKNTIFNSMDLSPLEAMIYTQPKQRDTLRIIPVVTSYMSNTFDRWLPILSCRLLKRIALEFNMSLLACLDMEPDQIRLTFLQKLPDELENDSLKIAILELVEACIEKQPGVTEAFFKVNYANYEKRIFGKETDSQIADSIVTYMEDYLEAVGKDPQIVEQILPSKIMNLFHSLWKHNMQILVDNLVQKPKFWTNLCQPLFGEYNKLNVKAYTQLLNILAIEIFCQSNSNSSNALKVVLKDFFNIEHFTNWLNFIFDLPKIPIRQHNEHMSAIINDEMPEWLCRLQAFKSFILILLRKQPNLVTITQEQLQLLHQHCLQILVERSEYIEDLRPFIILAELYLFIISSNQYLYESETSDLLKQFNRFLSNISTCYADLHVKAKESCLALIIRCTEHMAADLIQDTRLSTNFLYSIICIICAELQNLEESIRFQTQNKSDPPTAITDKQQQTNRKTQIYPGSFDSINSNNSLILCLNLLKTIATLFHNNNTNNDESSAAVSGYNWDSPFISNKIFQRLLSCTSSILQVHNKQQLSVELLDVLILFAKGNCSTVFLHCDVGDYLWLKLLPPKELLQIDFKLTQNREPNYWSVQLWWPIYSRGIELVTELFQKHTYSFLKEILQFVGIHEEYLSDSLLLSKQSLEPAAMDLIKATVTLLSHLVAFEKQWRLEHSQSLFNLMRSVQILMSHVINMFHQPKSLKLLIAGRRSHLDMLRETEDNDLADEMVTTFNNLTEVIILGAKCLLRFSPPLLDLICQPELLISQWEPIFQIHFGAPKLNENAIALTFGTVLSIVGVYTKVLNLQNYGFHEIALNVLPLPTASSSSAATSGANIMRNEQNATIQSSTARRPFSKSLSVASMSSINCPPNELLSNLDGELCLMALEHILTLAASQCMLALRNPWLPLREKQLVRREVSSELLSFHEFVRKKVLIDFREHKDIWQRRKHGQISMGELCSTNQQQIATSSKSTQPVIQRTAADTQPRRNADDLRVNVVRRLHLQQQQQQQQQRHIMRDGGTNADDTGTSSLPQYTAAGGFNRNNVMDISQVMSPIGGNMEGQQQHLHSTPYSEARLEADDRDEIQYFPPEEPKFTPLSYIQFVEEDYLHFMSNLFYVICQND